MTDIFKKIHNFLYTAFVIPRKPIRLEFILTDYCNLNCKGCTHYSPVAPQEFLPLEQLERDAKHLGIITGEKVENVYLIGGETLLYPQLPEAMSILRRHFPDKPIMLFTNGLLIPRMDETFWKAAIDNDVTLAITRYPISFDYENAEFICQKKGVKYKIFADRSGDGQFFRFALDKEKRQNRHIAHFKCFNRGCISIIDSKVFPCSISACVGHLNKTCGTNFEHCKGDFIAVDKIKSIRQLKRLRNRPVPFCGYCKKYTVTPYGPSKRTAAEWVD